MDYLTQKFNEFRTNAQAIVTKADAEKRSLTAEEKTSFDDLVAKAESVKAEIESRNKLNGLDIRATQGNRITNPESLDVAKDMSESEKRSYSMLRAISRRAAGLELDGIEKAVNDEITKRTGKSPTGFYVPWGLESRALDTTNGTGSVSNNLVPNLIDLLRAQTLVAQLGATYLPNVTGGFSLPRQTTGGTAYWVAESGAVTASTQVLDQVSFSSKTVGTYTDISRKFINMSGIEAEAFVRNDLTKVLALAIDTAALAGTGASNQPTGIIYDSNVPVVAIGTNGGAPTRAKLLEMEKTLAENNAGGVYKFVTTPAARSKMKGVDRGTDTGKYLWADDNTVEGYTAFATNLVPNNLTKGSASAVCSAGIMGDFSALMIALWGGLDILVDPYTGGSAGTVRIVAMQDVDIKIRTPKSFVITKDYTTT